MEVEMLKQTPYLGVYRKVGKVYDIVDERGGGDTTAQRWILKGIAKVVSVSEVPVPEKKQKVEK